MTSSTLAAYFRGRFRFGLRSAKVLMKSDTDGDGKENSGYQLLMKSLACQLQTADSMYCAPSSPQSQTYHLCPSLLNLALKDLCSGRFWFC